MKLLPPNYPDLLSGVRVVWHDTQCVLEEDGAPPQAFRVLDASLKPALENLLAGWVMERKTPRLLFLHANVMLHRPGGRLLFIAGDSGAGKSTLTRLTLERGEDWTLAAEDMAILDPDARSLIPFPRASSMRIEGDKVTGFPLWRPFGGAEGERKALVPQERYVTDPQPLARAVVVLLDPARAEPAPRRDDDPAEAQEFVFDLTWAGPELLEALSSGGFEPFEVTRRPGTMQLRVRRDLSTQELGRLCDLFEEHEAFLLEARRGKGKGAGRVRFAGQPACEPMPARVAVEALMPHLKRHRPGGESPDLPPPLFRLVKALHDAEFVRLRPGGTPEETLAELGPESRMA